MAKRNEQACITNSNDGRATAADAQGFAEAQARFGSDSLDATRFRESLRLQQAFAAIEAQADRDHLLALAERLANKSA